MRKNNINRKRLPIEAFTALEDGNAGIWNQWRKLNPEEPIDLRGLKRIAAPLRFFDLQDADLRHMELRQADLRGADLSGARLDGSILDDALLNRANCTETDFGNVTMWRASFRKAKILHARFKSSASLRGASFEEADCTGVIMRGVNLEQSNLSRAVFKGADLRKTSLHRAILFETSLQGADLRGARVDDAFIRRIEVDKETKQTGLTADIQLWFTKENQAAGNVTCVDGLRAAYFLGVLQERGMVSSMVNAGANSLVLILGRFTASRKPVLNALANVLQTKGKIPVIFDFPGPDDRELSDTVRLIATLSEFIVVDLSDPQSVPLELQATIPGLMVPVVPIIDARRRVFAMFQDLQRRYFWVLPPVVYADRNELLRHIDKGILNRVKLLQRRIDRRRAELTNQAISIGTFGQGDDSNKHVKLIQK